MSIHDWHVLGIPPIDSFEGMTLLTSYLFSPPDAGGLADPHRAHGLVAERKERLDWAGGALDALRRAGDKVHWDGEFRHEPYVGAFPWSNAEARYLLVKQDNNGTCFIITKGFAMPLPSHQTVYFSAVVRED